MFAPRMKKKIEVKPGDSRNEKIATGMKLNSLGKLPKRSCFMNGSSFEPKLESFWSRMLRGCVPDWVSLCFEFIFMNGSSFEPFAWIVLVAYARGCVPRFRHVFEFSFMNGLSFEPYSDHLIRFHNVLNLVS